MLEKKNWHGRRSYVNVNLSQAPNEPHIARRQAWPWHVLGGCNLARPVADAESVRRQNRGLILSALRREGPLSRTRLASATGLSHASITAIAGDLIGRHVLVELGDPAIGARARGRPATELSFNRSISHGLLVELDIANARVSLIDYAGTLVDRVEMAMTKTLLGETTPVEFLARRIVQMQDRTPEAADSMRLVHISVQGMLDRTGDALSWSPIAHVSGQSITEPLQRRFGVPVKLIKRGPLLAEGARVLYPALRNASLATIFIGSTVAMGLTMQAGAFGRGDEGATEFGHMIHIPGGARCRCGMRGCIEAYAADYGVLRTAYGVPEDTEPAPTVPVAEYADLIRQARAGRRNVLHAFHLAGRAIGYGLGRVLTVAAPSHIVVAGPGAAAYDLMQADIVAALSDSLVCRINGLPAITVHHDEREPIFQGMVIKALAELDARHAG